MQTPTLPRSSQNTDGFTLIEVLLALGIIAVLFALSFVNLSQPQNTTNINSVLDRLLADIRSQQLLAMTGNTGRTTSAQQEGIYIENNQFTLFAGSSYNPADTHNFTETAGTQLSTSFPGNTLLFNKGDGEVTGYSSGSDTITLTSGSETKTVTINRFGTATVE